MRKLMEIRAFDFEDEKMTSVWYTGDYSLLELAKVLGEENMELDEEETLQLYLDHHWVYNKLLIVQNTESIMDAPLGKLMEDYRIYDVVKQVESEY